MKMRHIQLTVDGVVRAELYAPSEASERVFQSFLRESAVPLLEYAVKKAISGGTGALSIDVRAWEEDV